MRRQAPQRFVTVVHDGGSTVISATSKYGIKQAIKRQVGLRAVVSQRPSTEDEIRRHKQDKKAAHEAKA